MDGDAGQQNRGRRSVGLERVTLSLIWVAWSRRDLRTYKLRCPEGRELVGLELSVEVTWESPAAVETLGTDERGRNQRLSLGGVHRRRGGAGKDLKQLET